MSPESTSPSGVSLLQQPRVLQLIEQGARLGKISYTSINELLGDLSVAEDEVEELLEALEARGIEVVETEEDVHEAPAVSSPSVASPRPRRSSKHGDLDDVLSSLENLEQFAGGKTSDLADAVTAQDDIPEGEVDDDIVVEDALRQYMN